MEIITHRDEYGIPIYCEIINQKPKPMSKKTTKAELEKQLHELRQANAMQVRFIEERDNRIAELKVNQKPEPKEFCIRLKGTSPLSNPVQLFEIEGVSAHDAAFLIKHALINLEQQIRLY
jgi:hypothetical protein